MLRKKANKNSFVQSVFGKEETIMADNERGYRPIDERIEFHQGILKERIKQLEGCNTSGRNDIEVEIEKEEQKIRDLKELKRKLLENSKFLFLIASDSTCKVIKTLPTYIETSHDARLDAERIMKKLLNDNHVELPLGKYIGIIVYKSFYDTMIDKENVSSIFKDKNAYVTSKEIIASSAGITVL